MKSFLGMLLETAFIGENLRARRVDAAPLHFGVSYDVPLSPVLSASRASSVASQRIAQLRSRHLARLQELKERQQPRRRTVHPATFRVTEKYFEILLIRTEHDPLHRYTQGGRETD